MCHHNHSDSCYKRDILTCQLKFSGRYRKHEAGAHDVQAGTAGTGFVQHEEDSARRCNTMT